MKEKKLTFAYLYGHDVAREEDFKMIDVINYSFAGIKDGEISISGLPNLENFVKKAHSNNVLVVLSIGGWGSGGFSEATRSAQLRKKLIDSIVEVVKKYDLDGIDYDWEYPTATAGGRIVASEDDKQNFTSLVKETRIALDNFKPNLILSSAFAAGKWAASKYYEVDKLNKYLDYFHIMTYDMINYPKDGNPTITSHHTNLYQSKLDNSSSADMAISAYIDEGADKNKVVLGIAFYGHVASRIENSKTGIRTEGYDFHNSVTYTKIHTEYLNNLEYNQFYDEEAEAPWLFNGDTFITYDNERSVKAKCEYVKTNDLGGVMFWQLNGDTTGTLLSTINKNLNK